MCESGLIIVFVSGFVDIDAVRALGRPFGRVASVSKMVWLRLERKDLLVRSSSEC